MAKATLHNCGASVPAYCQSNKNKYMFSVAKGQNEELECFQYKNLVVVGR